MIEKYDKKRCWEDEKMSEHERAIIRFYTRRYSVTRRQELLIVPRNIPLAWSAAKIILHLITQWMARKYLRIKTCLNEESKLVHD